VERIVELRIVYAGPPGSGKTTNLEFIRSVVSGPDLSDIVKQCVSSIGKSPVDFLFFEIERKGAGRLGFRIYSLPQFEDHPFLWKMILEGCHGIIVVIDSQLEKLEENQTCLSKIINFLSTTRATRSRYPVFFQYNKRDLPGALLARDLDDKLGLYAERSTKASAVRGKGVLVTLMEMSERLLEDTDAAVDRKEKVEEGLV